MMNFTALNPSLTERRRWVDLRDPNHVRFEHKPFTTDATLLGYLCSEASQWFFKGMDGTEYEGMHPDNSPQTVTDCLMHAHEACMAAKKTKKTYDGTDGGNQQEEHKDMATSRKSIKTGLATDGGKAKMAYAWRRDNGKEDIRRAACKKAFFLIQHLLKIYTGTKFTLTQNLH